MTDPAAARARSMALERDLPVREIAREIHDAALAEIDSSMADSLRGIDRRLDRVARDLRLASSREARPAPARGVRVHTASDVIGVALAAFATAVAFGMGKYSGTPTYQLEVVAPTCAVLLVLAATAHLVNAVLGRRQGATAAPGRPLVGATTGIATVIAAVLPIRSAVESTATAPAAISSVVALVVAMFCAVLWVRRAPAVREYRRTAAETEPGRQTRTRLVEEVDAARAEARAALAGLSPSQEAMFEGALGAAVEILSMRGTLSRTTVRQLRDEDWVDLRFSARP